MNNVAGIYRLRSKQQVCLLDMQKSLVFILFGNLETQEWQMLYVIYSDKLKIKETI